MQVSNVDCTRILDSVHMCSSHFAQGIGAASGLTKPSFKRNTGRGVAVVGSGLVFGARLITQLKAQGPSRTCNESQEEDKKSRDEEVP